MGMNDFEFEGQLFLKYKKHKIDKGSGKGKNKCGRRSTRENISLMD
jgi:hypothetical protein